MNPYPLEVTPRSGKVSEGMAAAVHHALLWLVVGNAIGVMIATLLLLPQLNVLLDEWSYGRWIIVHMNLGLYGWCSLPLIGFLFRAYKADQGSTAQWCRPVIWLWSAALVLGSISWLSGDSSGKLFLDWSGVARVFFPLAMVALWLLLAVSLGTTWKSASNQRGRMAKLGGLAVLLVVPAVIFIACNPNLYPAVNPDTGGPTGASQFESSLAIVAILLMLPYGLTRRAIKTTRVIPIAWLVLLGEAILCAALGRSDISHHRPAQYLSLGSLLLWIPLMPIYYGAFKWHPATSKWRTAFLMWWGALVVSGWVMFLPGVLDHFKFTDGLVGHSLTAIAGFVTALLIFVMIQLLGEAGWIFNREWSFYAWNAGVLAYVLLMTAAGWLEGIDPAFTIVPGVVRNLIYLLRLMTGLAMLAASLDWLTDSMALNRGRKIKSALVLLEKSA
jgi:cytochrome c oxidase cbb3-type subunit 1